MKKQVLLLVFVVLISKSFSLDCQYTEVSHELVDQSFLVYDGNQSIIGSPLNITDITIGNQWFCGGGQTCRNLATLKIHNPYYFDINVTLYVDVSGSCSTRSNVIKFQIKSRDYYLVETDGGYGSTPCDIIINEHTLSYHVDYPFNASEQVHQIQRNFLTCKICNGHNCTNDGLSCSINADCGGGYCVEGICNNQSLCYHNDCKCSLDKVQCSTNDKCVTKASLEVGSKPICRLEECKTNYINQSTGECAKSPEQILIEQALMQSELDTQIATNEAMILANQTAMIKGQTDYINTLKNTVIILLVFIFGGLGIGIFLYFKFKQGLEKEKQATEHEKQKTEKEKQTSLEKTIEYIKSHKDLLIKAKEELKELQKISKDSDIEKELIKNKKRDIEELEKELDEVNEREQKKIQEYIKPKKSHILGYGVWEWNNPNKNYYPCYVSSDGEKTNKLIHREQAEKKIYNKYLKWFKKTYSNKDFNNLIVHHIDDDYNNYKIENLAIITFEQHKKINHGNITKGNYKQGLDELKKLKIKQPHLNI